MSESRIAVFEEMVKDNPDEVMVWYGLASEYSKLSRWSDAANALKNVIRRNPDYPAAYQMLGTALMNLQDADEARRVWTAGIAAATRTGDWKAAQHMERLLAESASENQSDFCA
ncbi:MAG: tetratricopeptide repeat protein [Acidobacteriota bacterium]